MEHECDESPSHGDEIGDAFLELTVYKEITTDHSAYDWLLQSIKKELYLGDGDEVLVNIRETILRHLPRDNMVSRQNPPTFHTVSFRIDWKPRLFLEEQGYQERPEIALERAITLTGSITEAQAATTAEYLNQTWLVTGAHVLRLLRQVVAEDRSNQVPSSPAAQPSRPTTDVQTVTDYLPDGTKLVARYHWPDSSFMVIGTADTIAEIGEQLAWLASALRSSPFQSSLAICTASVDKILALSLPSERYLCHIQLDSCSWRHRPRAGWAVLAPIDAESSPGRRISGSSKTDAESWPRAKARYYGRLSRYTMYRYIQRQNFHQSVLGHVGSDTKRRPYNSLAFAQQEERREDLIP
jgi:hypothetical protein